MDINRQLNEHLELYLILKIWNVLLWNSHTSVLPVYINGN